MDSRGGWQHKGSVGGVPTVNGIRVMTREVHHCCMRVCMRESNMGSRL